MPLYFKLAIYLALFGIFVGLLVWLIRTFLDLIYAVGFNPILRNLLVGVLVILLLGCLLAAGYFLIAVLRQPGDGKPTVVSSEPQNAAEKTSAARDRLAEVRQQLETIEDEVAREAIAAQAAEIDKNLENQRIKIVVFGTGSSGKTSTINALLGKQVGTVGAAMGSTATSALYRWELPGISDPIEILDSPGILEAGAAGAEREGEAQVQALSADLLIFVVDGDLRQSEYEPLMALAELGKRSLLVLNKSDRYTELEQNQLLAQLRERVRYTIAFEDVILAAARPTPIVVAGQSYPIEPKIQELKQRIQEVLKAEGRSLILDNALLQSQKLSAEAKRILGKQLEKEAEKVVERFQWIVTAAVFANPLPVVDLLATAAINAQMVVEIGGVYGCKLNLARGRELAYSLAKTLAGMGLVEGSIQLMTGIMTAVAEVTVVGFIVTAPIQAASAGYLTRIAGRSFIEYFKRDGSWGDGGIEQVVQEQVERTKGEKRWTESFVREAIRKLDIL